MKYTREQIEVMPAGTELDILIAIHVFQFIWDKPGRGKQKLRGSYGDDLKDEVFGWRNLDTGEISLIGYMSPWLPAFSTRILNAWQVVEKMRGTKDEVRFWIASQKNGGWEVQTEARTSLAVSSAEEASLPLAICKAALLLLCWSAK